MKIVVTGSRDYADEEFLFSVLDKMDASEKITQLAEGGCRGADLLAHDWLWNRREDMSYTYHPDWKTGKAAGPIRNEVMLREFKPDLVVAFKSTKQSKGTDDCLRQARELGIKTIEYIGRELVEHANK